MNNVTVDAAEAALVDGIDVIPVRTLAELVAHLKGELHLAPLAGGVAIEEVPDPEPMVDLAHVKGQEHARRALESLTLDRGAAHLKDELMPRYAELIYNGFWFSPER